MIEHGLIEKVTAYITWGDRLLVFTEPDHPEAGVQIPGGTVEEGEPLEEAVLREAMEEAGLEELRVKDYLGAGEYNFTDVGYGRFRRHFFHLEFAGDSPDSWLSFEETPSDGTPGPIRLEFRWVRFPDELPELAGEQGDLLEKIKIV